MAQLSGSATYLAGEDFVEGDETFHWFHPMQELELQTGGTGPVFEFWCANCGGAFQSQAIPDSQLDPAHAPVYSALTALCINSVGLCELLRQQMYSSFWHRITGGSENEPHDCGVLG